MSEITTARKIGPRWTAREAQLRALFGDKTYTVVAAIKLPADAPKFTTVVGAKGRNGFLLADTEGNPMVVGAQTLKDGEDLGAVHHADDEIMVVTEI